METKDTSPLNLYQRISAVMKDIEYLNKDKQVGEGNYSYKAVSEESVTGAVREKMIKHGLVLFPVAQTHRHEELPRVDRSGKDSILSLTTVEVTYKLANVDDMSQFELIASSGTGVDPQDKGVGKAMTYAMKYALLRTFMIPTGNDPDAIHNEELERQAPAGRPTTTEAHREAVCQARDCIRDAKSKVELRELWDGFTAEVKADLKDESKAAAARIDTAILQAASTPAQ